MQQNSTAFRPKKKGGAVDEEMVKYPVMPGAVYRLSACGAERT
jgi:hypothetical protein